MWCTALAMRLTSLMKPMSSMRSASSSTSQRVSERLMSLSRRGRSARPGVATRMSTPGAIFFTWLERDTPPSTSAVETCRPLASTRIVSSICTASSRVGAQDQRARRLRRALGAERHDLGQDRQAEGRRLARARLCNREDVAAREIGRDRLFLHGLRRIESGIRGRLEQRAGDAEFARNQSSSALISFVNLFFFHAGYLPQTTRAAGRNLRRA